MAAVAKSRILNLTVWEKRFAYTSIGFYGRMGCIEWSDKSPQATREAMVSFCCPSLERFSGISAAVIRKHCSSMARCVSCGSMWDREIESKWLWAGTRYRFLVCSCNCPIWYLSSDRRYKITSEISKRTRDEARRKQLCRGKWKHNKIDVARILLLQNRRCLYCNRLFNSKCQATKDHLLPVAFGGTNSKWNIVMACRSCNSRRETITFRAYCRLLSARQGKEIIRIMRKRVEQAILEDVSDEEFFDFAKAYDFHVRAHGRVIDICSRSRSAASNQKNNKIFPTFLAPLKGIKRLPDA